MIVILLFLQLLLPINADRSLQYDTCLSIGSRICQSITGHVIQTNEFTVPDCTIIKGTQDCSDIKGKTGKNYICVNGILTAVYCDFDSEEGAWLVFQRRADGSVNFYRKWIDYAEGFGDVTEEFWLGLLTLNKITRKKKYVLRIELSDFEDEVRYAQYSFFNVSSEASKFLLSVGTYQGDAGDSLTPHNGAPFTTLDADHDTYKDNCAVSFRGAWWYTECHSTNLNGLYLGGVTTEYATGVVWKSWKEYYYSLKTVEMKIRRI